MRLSTFILFNLAMTLVFFCVGYYNLLTSVAFGMYSGSMGMNIDTSTGNLTNASMSHGQAIEISNSTAGHLGLVQTIAQSILIDTNTAIAFGLAIALLVAISYLSGFSANFLVPALIIIVVMNFLFFPISILMDASLPLFFKFFIFAVYNTFTIISAVDFIRGGM